MNPCENGPAGPEVDTQTGLSYDDLRARLQTLLLYAPDATLRGALELIDRDEDQG